jgi:hypothetical protein
LRQIFLAILHDQEKKSCTVDFTPSHLEDTNEVRMRPLRGCTPAGKLFVIGNFRGHELDGSFSSTQFGQEHRAVIGASEPPSEGKLPGDYSTFPRFP